MFFKGFLCGVLVLCIVQINAAPTPTNDLLSNAHAEGKSGVLQISVMEPSDALSIPEKSSTNAPGDSEQANDNFVPLCCKPTDY